MEPLVIYRVFVGSNLVERNLPSFFVAPGLEQIFSTLHLSCSDIIVDAYFDEGGQPSVSSTNNKVIEN